MKKSIIQGIISIILFLGTWFGLSNVDWESFFKLQQITDNTETKRGDIFWETFKQTEKENKNVFVVHAVDSIIKQICATNHIDKEKIKVHILDKDEINAFALPNGHLVIYSGLILKADNQDELTGVVCHEIAHIEQNHVMKKLIKEIGLSVLISISTGGSGTEVIKETVKMLSSSSFDRALEKEADLKAVEYLVNANVNPEPFANFLYKLSANEQESMKYLTWISTHPDSKERAEYIIEQIKGAKKVCKPILANDTWDKMKEELI